MIPAHNLAETDDQVYFPTLSHSEPFAATFHDGTVRIRLDVAAFDFHIDASARALPSVVQGYVALARRMGFMPMPREECEPELLDDGFVRLYMVPIEPVADIRFEMPSLAETAYGPYSMEIPAIDVDMLRESATDNIKRVASLPPLPYRSEPAQYEQTWTGPKRRGRHRAKP